MSAAAPLTTPSNVNRDTSRSQGGRSAAKPPAAAERQFSLRGFTSMLLMLCLLMVLASGITLYLAPRGRVANWTSWTALLLSRPQWVAVHINASVLFVVASVTHLAMNWSRLVGYVKKRARLRINMTRELASAVAVASLIFAATILELSPISLPVEFRYEVRDSWEQPVEPSAARHRPVAHQSSQAAR